MTEAVVSTLTFDELPRGAAPGDGATRRIADALRDNMAEAPDALYNEALGLARDGHLGQASARLQMLLCLDPQDADGQLLFAKVLAAQGRPSEALGRLTLAVDAGAFEPAGFREELEAEVRTERARDEESRARLASREQGEVRALRHEARTLRSETIRLETEVADAQRREALWRGGAILGAIAASGLALAFALWPTTPTSAVPGAVADGIVAAEPVAAEPVAAEPVAAEPVAAPPVAAAPVAQKAPPPVAAAVQAANAAVPGKPGAVGATHVVASGDTLRKIAKRYYGHAGEWERIRDANAAVLGGGDALSLGMKLVVP